MSVVMAPVAPAARSSKFKVKRLAPQKVVQGAKSLSGRIAKTDRSLLGRSSSKPLNVVVKLDYDAAASYAGGITGLRATSPEVTGRPLARDRAALDAYTRYAAGVERRITGDISARVRGARIVDSFRIAYGGVAMRLPANQIDELLEVDGVVAVQKNRLAQPLTDRTPEFIGATKAWESISGPSTSGEGVIVGVLDTGVWPNHPSFKDPGIDHPGGTFDCDFGDGSDPRLGAPFNCNDKLIGAHAFTDAYMMFIGALRGEFCNNETDECSARDANGHGTHTSTTAAGSPVDSARLIGIERGPISGIAPGAHVIGYRVCLDLGCFQSDSVAAVEQAILDGVDVINFSISGGGDPFSDSVELAFLDAYAAGISVNASAGNSGPDAATADHAGPWVTTVGASTSDRHFLTTVKLRSGDGDVFEVQGATITRGLDPARRVIRAGNVKGYKDETCSTPLPNKVKGRVVLCQGNRDRAARGFNVREGGGAGMILYNPESNDLFTDNHWLPSVMVSGASRTADLISFLESNSGVRAQWKSGKATR
ncbi:MAG: S8 family peptidase, partial [Actinobacteria bacterium]|nr:S8 family peptidase [Actinomycetota bacterium]